MTGVFAGNLDGDVGIVNQIAFDNHSRATVAILPVGAQLAMVDGIVCGSNIENGVLKIPAVASLVEAYIGRDPLKANVVNANVVVVVDQVLGHSKELDVAIERHVLAAAGGVVIEFIAADRNIVDGSRCQGAVDCHSQGIGAVTGAQRLNNVVDMIVQNLYVAACP